MRYRWKLTHYTVGEKNRAQNCLTVSNIKLDDVFSDVFGKTASAITDKLLESNEPFDVSPHLNKRIKTPAEKIQAAVDGELCAEQAEKLRIIRSHMNSLELCKAHLESLILSTAQKFLPQLELVMTVPGIQSYSAIGIISEIGVDMSVFPSSKHLCSWAGLTPQNNESAGNKKTTRISRAGAYIKPLLVQCALTVCKSSKHPEIKNRYLSLKNAGGTRNPLSLSQECCSLPSTTFSKRMSHTIRSFISVVTTLRRNTGQYPWRRPSSFCSVRAISLPPAPVDRLCYYIFSATTSWPGFVRPFADSA